VRIVFLNTWDGKVKEEIGKFFDREIALGTDVFCLQEIYDKTKLGSDLLLSNFNHYDAYKKVGEKDAFSQLTFVKKCITEVTFSVLGEENASIGSSLLTQLKINNQIFSICNVHGLSQPGNKLDTKERLEHSKLIIDTLVNQKGPKIVGGDFNLEFETKSVRLFEEAGYKNQIKDFGIRTTRNRYVWDRYPGSKQYYSDYVFVSSDVSVLNFEVPNIEVSDHLPLTLEINT